MASAGPKRAFSWGSLSRRRACSNQSSGARTAVEKTWVRRKGSDEIRAEEETKDESESEIDISGECVEVSDLGGAFEVVEVNDTSW